MNKMLSTCDIGLYGLGEHMLYVSTFVKLKYFIHVIFMTT